MKRLAEKTKITEKEASQLIKFVEKSIYNPPVGDVIFRYEITMLQDKYESILINPDIINPDSTQALKVTDIKVDFRYPEKNLVDYFDVSLYVESETVPSDEIYLDFYDSNGKHLFEVQEFSAKAYPAKVEKVGNGGYYIFSTVDLRKDELKQFSKKLKLLVEYVDNEGLGLAADGSKNKIKYGFTQNQEELETFELKNVVSEYNSYDFETESGEFSKIIKEYVIPEEIQKQIEELEARKSSGELSDEEIEQIDYEIWDLTSYWHDINNIAKWENEKIMQLIKKQENSGIADKSIIEIELPQKYDPKKDIFIKVATDNGINGSEYAVFTIPATPRVLGIERTRNDTGDSVVELEMFSKNQFTQKRAFVFDPDMNLWHDNYETFVVPDYYEKNNEECFFYAGAYLQSGKFWLERFERFFDLYSLDFEEYAVTDAKEELKKFSESAEIDIIPGKVNSCIHTVSVKLEKNVFDQFDRGFVKYD